MISPIQLYDIALHDVSLFHNPDWEAPVAPKTRARVFVRGEHAFGAEGDTPPPGEIWLDFDIFTSLQTLDDEGDSAAPADVVEVGERYSAYLHVGINDLDDTLERSPFMASLGCSAYVSVLSVPKGAEGARAFSTVVRANAAGMLYGVARHVLLQLSQTTESIVLPSLSFRRVVQREQEIEAREQEESE